MTLKRLISGTYVDYAFNDDWGSNVNAEAIALVTGQLGAFDLTTGSKDAVLLLDQHLVVTP